MQIGSLFTTSSVRGAKGVVRTAGSDAEAGDGTTISPRASTSSSAPDLRNMTPNEMWDYTWKLKESGQISDIDFAILNPAVFPWDPSAETGDFSTYLNTIRNKPMDHVERLETDISYAQTGEMKARLRDLLDRIKQIAGAGAVDVTA